MAEHDGRLEILVIGDFPIEPFQELGPRYRIEHLPHGIALDREHARAIAVVTRSHVVVDAEFLDRLPYVKLVIRAGSGLDNMDLAELARRNVDVRRLGSHHSSRSVAELAVLAELTLLRRAVIAHTALARGTWLKPRLLGHELAGRRLGIAGFGPVGKACADTFAALGCIVKVHNRSGAAGPHPSETSKSSLLDWAHDLIVALPDSQDTSNFVDNNAIAQLGPTANVINVSRWGLVHVPSAVRALRHGRLFGLAVDPVDSSHVQHVLGLGDLSNLNLLLLPHLGAHTHEAQLRGAHAAANTIRECLADDGPR